MPPSPWTAWTPVGPFPALTGRVLAELVDGGQAFRWRLEPGDVWRGQWLHHVVRLKCDELGRLLCRTPTRDSAKTLAALHRYLGLDRDFIRFEDDLPWRSDTALAQARAAFPGLRILRQPFGETLLGFLCSATKQIVQIRQMMDALAIKLGAPLGGGLYRLPTWPELARVSEAQLRACALGFRARYIHETARRLADHPGWLEETEQLPYSEAKVRLCELPGVGEKVADCVLLFGAGRLEAFPVDTWIIRIMSECYGLEGWSPAQVAHFGRTHFGPHAGLAQQFLFAWARARSQE